MEERLIEVLECEVRRQCEIFYMSAMYLQEAVNSDMENKSTIIWYHIQSYLTSSANVSRLLWGSYKKNDPKNKPRKKLRRQLREKMGVSEDSILKSRKMRNLFEHYDEHIEEWATQPNSNGIYVDSNIGPKSGIYIEGLNEKQQQRHFDPAGIITYQNYEYNMSEIMIEMTKIHPFPDPIYSKL